MENKITLKSVRELLGMKFFIPSYQRGYRWTTQQVKDLLEDIWHFASKDHSAYEFYCMQPLVVREMPQEDKTRNNLSVDETWYEVIDGQQRLTTLFLILSSRMQTLEALDYPTNLYTLRYERELNRQDDILARITEIQETDKTQIDRFHLSSAFLFTKEWFKSNHIDSDSFCQSMIKQPDEGDPQRDKAIDVRFIWYESVDEDPIKVFTRLNIGKISLTNAELIKALFLNRSNFGKPDHIRLRQQEIAGEWDAIENTLQDEAFWLFLHKKGYDRPTRIDFIFDLIREHDILHLDEKVGTDSYNTFRYFYAYFSSPDMDMAACWRIVKNYFQTFMEWYDDIEMYHYTGYLIACGRDINELIKIWETSEDKKSFKKELKKKILSIIHKCPSLDYQYKDDGSDKGKCRPILLFHNIQTAINQNSLSQGTFYKFPFHLYKNEGWDVEHINSNTSNPEEDEKTRQEWLVNVYLSVNEETQKRINAYFETTSDDRKKALYDEIKQQVPPSEPWTQQEKNRLWNYTLLDSSTNRSYGNAIFSAKRRILIGKDRGQHIPIPKISDKKLRLPDQTKETSCFVPPCTKQVFLKYYSPTVGDINYWTKSIDAEGYLKDISNCIKQLEE